MAVKHNASPREGLTFDDVLIKPGLSEVLPADVDIRSHITRSIAVNIPIIASAMDTVTEAQMAIAMAQAGGIGVVHRNMEPEEQAAQVRQVKKFESGMVVNPLTIEPGATLQQALDRVRGAFQQVPMIGALKAAIAHFGSDPAWNTVRPPLTQLAPAQQAQLLTALDAIGFAMPGLAA